MRELTIYLVVAMVCITAGVSVYMITHPQLASDTPETQIIEYTKLIGDTTTQAEDWNVLTFYTQQRDLMANTAKYFEARRQEVAAQLAHKWKLKGDKNYELDPESGKIVERVPNADKEAAPEEGPDSNVEDEGDDPSPDADATPESESVVEG